VVIRGASRLMEERHTVRTPENIMGGQYSLPFTTAVALTRDLSNPLAYNDAVTAHTGTALGLCGAVLGTRL
jgi:hypothetical protein